MSLTRSTSLVFASLWRDAGGVEDVAEVGREAGIPAVFVTL